MRLMGRWEQGEAPSQSSLCPLFLLFFFILTWHHPKWLAAKPTGPVCNAVWMFTLSLFDNFLQLFLSVFFFGPDGDKPQQAGITAQWLNSLRPLHLSARCNGAGCSVVLVGRGRQAVLLCYEAMPLCQGISPHTSDICRGKKVFFWVVFFTDFPSYLFCSFPHRVMDSTCELSSRHAKFYLQTHSPSWYFISLRTLMWSISLLQWIQSFLLKTNLFYPICIPCSHPLCLFTKLYLCSCSLKSNNSQFQHYQLQQ